MKLGIYGTGGFGREILELAKQIEVCTSRWDEIIFINDFIDDGRFLSYRVFQFSNLKKIVKPNEIEIVIGVGNPEDRNVLSKKVKGAGYKLATLVHPNVFVPDSVSIADGVVVQAQCILSCNVELMSNSYMNFNSLISHDSCIGENSGIGPNVSISGHCMIGSNTYIGIGALIKEDVTIGDSVIIGMGSVVTRDIDNEIIAVGYPARPSKINIDKKVF